MSLRWLWLHHRTRHSISRRVHFSTGINECHAPCVRRGHIWRIGANSDGTALTRTRVFKMLQSDSRTVIKQLGKIDHHLCLIMMVVQTKGSACTSGCTRLPTHTRAAVIAWMIHVLSRLQLHEKAAWWCYPQRGRGRGRGRGEGKKKNLTEDLRGLRSHWGKMSRTLCSKKRRDL